MGSYNSFASLLFFISIWKSNFGRLLAFLVLLTLCILLNVPVLFAIVSTNLQIIEAEALMPIEVLKICQFTC